MITYPAISLHQPYASLIISGAKQWETRHWRAPDRVIGQRVAIHAAKRRVALLHESDQEFFEACAETLGDDWLRSLPFGAIVGTAVLARCHQIARVDRADGMMFANGECELRDPFGDYAPGRFVWRMINPKPINPPVPCVGRQGWFRWDG